MNTSTREGLPNSFLEAAAHGCAILSAVNPDGFASEFGWHVKDDRFALGLQELLHHHHWKEKGLRGQAHVIKTFEITHAIDEHLRRYEQVLSHPRQRQSHTPIIFHAESYGQS